MAMGFRGYCYACGERGHMAAECPHGGVKKCFHCNEFGHISTECPELDDGRQDLSGDWRRQLELARECGWEPRKTKGSNSDGYNTSNKTLFLRHPDGGRIDLYTTTLTVKTVIEHPKQGNKPLFRTAATVAFGDESKLQAIFEDTRVHSGVGWRMAERGWGMCRECGLHKQRDEFSVAQWKKRGRSAGGKILCEDCK